ncbi:MAG: sensor histidine kinase [Opitutales bacterium]
MNFRSLRFRLVFWYALCNAVVFAVAGTLLHFGLRHYLEINLGVTQTRRAERIALLVGGNATRPKADIATVIIAGFAPEVTGRFIRVRRADGTVVYQSGKPLDGSFDPALISSPAPAVGNRRERQADGTELMVATVPAGPGLYVETGESLATALLELNRLLVSLGLAFAVVAAVALVGGILLVSRTLRPVEQITRSAERITSHNLSERLPEAQTGDEFAHLSRSLNRMITRLDEAFQLNRRFLADASHELRTPLTILRSELEAMLRSETTDTAMRESIGNLLEEVSRLSRIVENLFALSRLESDQMHVKHIELDLARLVSVTSEQMCLLAEDKGLTIECRTSTPVLVEGDSARLKQVIVNLLDNAIKYTPSGGTVRLSVAARGREAVFEVADTGIGIPPDAIPRVFDRFFRVDPARSREIGGAGIGLSIVKAICLAHRGTVEVRSVENQGSCFRVCLPLAGKNSFPN